MQYFLQNSVFAVKPMARKELWILADADNAGKMVKFHELKATSDTDKNIADWYIFKNFDIFTVTAQSVGNTLSQTENSLIAALNTRNRLPNIIMILMGDQLLADKQLMAVPRYLRQIFDDIFGRCQKHVRQWMSFLPPKAQPFYQPKFMVVKPLPKPERQFQGREELYQELLTQRKAYNDQLVPALHKANMQFVNVGITHMDSEAFIRIGHIQDANFKLSPKGLRRYWEQASEAIAKLNCGLGAVNLDESNKGATAAGDTRIVTTSFSDKTHRGGNSRGRSSSFRRPNHYTRRAAYKWINKNISPHNHF